MQEYFYLAAEYDGCVIQDAYNLGGLPKGQYALEFPNFDDNEYQGVYVL